MNGNLRHQGIQSNGARVIGYQETSALRWQIFNSTNFNAEPFLIKHTKNGEKNLLGELWIKTKFINCVIAAHALGKKVNRRIEAIAKHFGKLRE